MLTSVTELSMKSECLITEAAVSLFTVPADAPEGDGTFCWKSTFMVLVRLRSGNTCGTGYTYADAGTATVAHQLLKEIVLHTDATQHADALSSECSAPFATWARPASR